MGRGGSDTPVMRQYLNAKQRYPEAVLFFRLGDFYEMFFEDAVIAAEVLDLVLTSRDKSAADPVPMCGVPHHSALGYISRLVQRGYKVAICEQMEDPSKVKGLVKREVVRLVTPGVVLDPESLDAKTNNYLVCVFRDTDGPDVFGLAILDASTGEFRGARIPGWGMLLGELGRIDPREVVIHPDQEEEFSSLARIFPSICITTAGKDDFDQNNALSVLKEIFGAGSVSSEAISGLDQIVVSAAGAALAYVQRTQPSQPVNIRAFAAYSPAEYMLMDETTISHLELVRSSGGAKKGTLLGVLDFCRTSMGGRLLRRRLLYPLLDTARIGSRLDRAEFFFSDNSLRKKMQDLLSELGDLERLAQRTASLIAVPRDLGAIRDSLAVLPSIAALMDEKFRDDSRQQGEMLLGPPLDCAEDIHSALDAALVEKPPVSSKDGGIFRKGCNSDLDELAELAASAKDFIKNLQTRQRERTGIQSLKVGYNRVFGYYIEVTKPNLKLVPDDFVRRQTLTNSERFVTVELEEWERKVLTAEEKKKELELKLFQELLAGVSEQAARLGNIAGRIADLDVSVSIAEAARKFSFSRPAVSRQGSINITEGRHPVVDVLLDEPFVPNDVALDPAGERILLITGPNMSGKTTFMRQVALITIMAQAGMFVPAQDARIAVCDRLFTRVGASDSIATGQSTFMVEMREVARILKKAGRNSLIILDEVGRGTSTTDGLSIAWAVTEYLHDVVGSLVLFATHFHELVELAHKLRFAANYHVAAEEYEGDIAFLHKVMPGGTSRSYGVEVARLAGVPESVIGRSKELLASSIKAGGNLMQSAKKNGPVQLDIFSGPKGASKVERALKEVDVDRLTPMEALALVNRLKKSME